MRALGAIEQPGVQRGRIRPLGQNRSPVRSDLSVARKVFSDERILYTLCTELSWPHIRQLMFIDDKLKRDFYIEIRRKTSNRQYLPTSNPSFFVRRRATAWLNCWNSANPAFMWRNTSQNFRKRRCWKPSLSNPYEWRKSNSNSK